MLFGIVLLSSCGKEISEQRETSITNEETQSRIEQIERFVAAMSSETQLRSEGVESEYSPEQFLKNTEESINYVYAIPFSKYWKTETYKDSLVISISNCKILSSEAPAKYQQILDKVICRYVCSNLNNKKLKFVKIDLISKNCNEFKLSLTTILGTKDVTPSLDIPNPPGPSGIAHYRKQFTQDRNAQNGTCLNPSGSNTCGDLAEYATYNIIGGEDFTHTVIDLSSFSFYNFEIPQIHWWQFHCYDPNFPSDCGGLTSCELYFVTVNGNIDYNQLTQLGYDEHCLTVAEINPILSDTEEYFKNYAANHNKDFVNLWGSWTFSLCFDYHHIWHGTCSIGTKIYRNQNPIELTGTCNCI